MMASEANRFISSQQAIQETVCTPDMFYSESRHFRLGYRLYSALTTNQGVGFFFIILEAVKAAAEKAYFHFRLRVPCCLF